MGEEKGVSLTTAEGNLWKVVLSVVLYLYDYGCVSHQRVILIFLEFMCIVMDRETHQFLLLATLETSVRLTPETDPAPDNENQTLSDTWQILQTIETHQ